MLYKAFEAAGLRGSNRTIFCSVFKIGEKSHLQGAEQLCAWRASGDIRRNIFGVTKFCFV